MKRCRPINTALINYFLIREISVGIVIIFVPCSDDPLFPAPCYLSSSCKGKASGL
ncbi:MULTISPECIES: hypothetical protein [unclassified Moorena]|uniref:hypothetical protein n=1 Tax=unclassified Moorena TaxID=2683338 RepID=UPI0013BF2ACA|nr:MULTISPECIES: hypothetical protein [unclassified Moorena]NEO05303.1 hypothetical protein [Moorena sp. SIO3I8]NEO21211.1 hypothetical protein [Moorena sp. SIO4A5]NEP24966.1 hypothetical protein [Moorena sp. SIO3I6]NEQ57806.1 hypothetical protein [Moorena sp. SIO4A1]